METEEIIRQTLLKIKSKAKLAKLLNVSEKTVYRWINREVKPNSDNIIKMLEIIK